MPEKDIFSSFFTMIRSKMYILLKRIADCKMQGHAVFELGNVVITALAGIIRIVQGNAQIQTKDQEVEIVAQTGTSTQ